MRPSLDAECIARALFDISYRTSIMLLGGDRNAHLGDFGDVNWPDVHGRLPSHQRKP